MSEQIRNGTIIVMPENDQDNTKLVHVLKRANGFTVSDHRVYMDDLLKALFGMMEAHELAQLILAEEKGSLDQILEPVFKSQNPKIIFRCLELVLNRCKSENDMRMLSVIFRSIAERFDLSQVDEKSLNHMLNLILGRVNHLVDEDTLIHLFISLLKKINVADARKEVIGLLLRELSERAATEKDNDIKRWFQDQITSYMPAQKTVTTPLLPQGTLMYQEELSGRRIVVMEVEKQQQDILYYNTHLRAVGHPKLLFEFVLLGKRIEGCRIFALKDGPIKPTSQLFQYPFGNVFKNYSACWPQLNEIEITQLTQLRNLPKLFFKSSTNDHAYSGKNLRELYINLQGNDFDDETLVYTGFTVADQFELISCVEDEDEPVLV